MVNLVDELQKSYNGDAWHGSNILALLLKADAAKVFTHPIPNAHSIAELVLHLTAWTEEVLERLNGAEAKEPLRGDWPMPMETSMAEWDLIVNDFKKANQKVIDLINDFVPASWTAAVRDLRDRELGTGVNNAQLLNGLIQHHAYHAGQIALLCKF